MTEILLRLIDPETFDLYTYKYGVIGTIRFCGIPQKWYLVSNYGISEDMAQVENILRALNRR